VKFVRAAASQVLGLFIADWLQTGVIIVILGAGWFAFTKFGAPALVALVALLAVQLVWFALAEAEATKRSRQTSPS
jgi:hypothetical protein